MWRAATRQPKVEDFTKNLDPTTSADVTDVENCLEYFLLITNDELLNQVVEETNHYPDQFFSLNAGTLPAYSRANKWYLLTLPDLKKFLGQTFTTGLLGKGGSLADYWSKNPVLHTPFFGQTMPRNRYQNILKFLHFNNNETRPFDTTDKLYKLQPI